MTEERFMNYIDIIHNYLKENLTACTVGFIDPHDEQDAQRSTRSFLINCPNQKEKHVRFTRHFIQEDPQIIPMTLHKLDLANYIMHNEFVDFSTVHFFSTKW